MPETNETTETTETVETTEETSNEETVQETKADANESTEKTEETVEKTESTEQAETKPETKAESEEKPSIERMVPKAEDYVLPEGMPGNVAEFAAANDMTQDQLDKTLAQFSGYIANTKDVEKKILQDSGNKHVEEWGEKKDYNLALVRRALSQNDPDGSLGRMLNETGYGNHPAVLDFFLKIGNSMKEGGFIKGAVNRPEGKKTAASAMFGKSHPSNN